MGLGLRDSRTCKIISTFDYKIFWILSLQQPPVHVLMMRLRVFGSLVGSLVE